MSYVSEGLKQNNLMTLTTDESVAAALKDIKLAIQSTRVMQQQQQQQQQTPQQPPPQSDVTLTATQGTRIPPTPLSEADINTLDPKQDPWIVRPNQNAKVESDESVDKNVGGV